MRITGSTYTSITTATPKVVETGKGFLVNTQYYTKERLSPVPLEFLRVSGSPYAVNTVKQLYLQNPSWKFSHDEVEIYKDSTYANRYYVRVIGGYVDGGDLGTTIVVLEEDDNKELRCINMVPLVNLSLINFVDQDETNVYIQLRGAAATYLYALNKSTFAVTSKWTSTGQSKNYVQLTKLYSDDANIHFMYIFDQNIYTMTFNKSTQTASTSQAIYRGEDATGTANILTILNDSISVINEDTSGLYLFNTGNAAQPIDLYTYDRTKSFADGFKMSSVNITWNDEKSKVDFTVGVIANTIRMFISEFDGVKYLNVVSFNTVYNVPTYIPVQGITTFRIDSDTELTFMSYNQIDETEQIGGFIYDVSKEHLIVAKLNSFEILKFNKEKAVYESTGYEVPACYSVGLDELQRIWYIKTDGSAHMINLEDAQSVEIKFEKDYYEYAGSSIETYITFSALNYLGEQFKGRFELSLSGPAVFADEGSTVITFDYTGEGEQQIPVTILGASPVTIYPKFIKLT